MTPEDRKLARDLLGKNLLTVDQVSQIKDACESTGRPFADVAAEKGFLTPREAQRMTPPPPKPRGSRVWPLLLGGAALVLLCLLVFTPYFFQLEWGMDEKDVEEGAQWRAQAERDAVEVRKAYQRKLVAEREERIGKSLSKARTTMAFVEDRLSNAVALPDLYDRLTDAIIGFTDYLRVHSDNARVLSERARAYEIRGDYGRAVQDLELAVSLDKSLEPKVRNTLQELKLKLPK